MADPIRLPVRTQVTVERTSARERDLTVFCPLRERSMPLGHCMTCPRMCRAPEDDAQGTAIHCRIERRPLVARKEEARAPGPVTALAARELIGTAMAERTVCARPDVPLAALRDILHEERAVAIPVVASNGTLLGLAWRRDVELPDGLRDVPARMAGEVTDSGAFRFSERARLSSVLSMVASARFVTVVDRRGAVVGSLSDLDLLRWFVRTRA